MPEHRAPIYTTRSFEPALRVTKLLTFANIAFYRDISGEKIIVLSSRQLENIQAIFFSFLFRYSFQTLPERERTSYEDEMRYTRFSIHRRDERTTS